MKDVRKHQRIIYAGTVRLCWEDASGEPRYAQSKCIDVSESGLRIEVPAPVPVRGTISVRAERLKISGSASVKHTTRVGARYHVGVELNQKVRGGEIAELRAGAPPQPPIV